MSVIKALMVITMVSGGEYTAKLPSMEQGMKEIAPVESQRDVKSAACIPRTEDRLSAEVFSQIMDTFLMFNDRDRCGDYYPPREESFEDEDVRDYISRLNKG